MQFEYWLTHQPATRRFLLGDMQLSTEICKEEILSVPPRGSVHDPHISYKRNIWKAKRLGIIQPSKKHIEMIT